MGEDDGGNGGGVGAWGGEVVGVAVVLEDFERHLGPGDLSEKEVLAIEK